MTDSALPAIDALLREMERIHSDVVTIQRHGESGEHHWHRVHAAECEAVDMLPRLAATLRVAVEALYGGANLVNGRAECRAALARIEQMAKGDARA